MAQLISEEQLENVTGGGAGDVPASGKPMAFYSYGVYWETSYKEGAEYTLARSFTNLYADYAAPKAPAPYLVYHGDIAIGWTTESQFHWL